MTVITIELEDKLFMDLALLAHEKDITFNQLVNEILLQSISKFEMKEKFTKEIAKVVEKQKKKNSNQKSLSESLGISPEKLKDINKKVTDLLLTEDDDNSFEEDDDDLFKENYEDEINSKVDELIEE